MLLVVGLGNPGREHEGQRHNVGFVVTNELQKTWGLPDFKSKWSAAFTRGEFLGKPVALLQPQTYMNLSGDSVQPAVAFLGVGVIDVLVVHDELDLPWREVRVKVGGGHAGHNGLRSIVQRLGSSDFARVRVGIGRPAPDFRGDVADWVLSRFGPTEKADLPSVIAAAATAATAVLTDGSAVAMRVTNTKKS